MADIEVTWGELMLEEFFFSTADYQPPQYPRSISYEDAAVSNGVTVVNTRSVTDLGPLLGVWRAFTIQCYNKTNWDDFVPGRGQLFYDRLLHLTTDFIGVPLTLTETGTGQRYRVMFTADGLTVSFAPPNGALAYQTDPATGERVYVGPEYNVQINLIQVRDD